MSGFVARRQALDVVRKVLFYIENATDLGEGIVTTGLVEIIGTGRAGGAGQTDFLDVTHVQLPIAVVADEEGAVAVE